MRGGGIDVTSMPFRTAEQTRHGIDFAGCAAILSRLHQAMDSV
jgi:hypothetical protein